MADSYRHFLLANMLLMLFGHAQGACDASASWHFTCFRCVGLRLRGDLLRILDPARRGIAGLEPQHEAKLPELAKLPQQRCLVSCVVRLSQAWPKACSAGSERFSWNNYITLSLSLSLFFFKRLRKVDKVGNGIA